MNTVVIDGVTYTKAATLAKKFRYTSDYVGQLCRSGKVDAQLVGRSWYVSEDSLEHASKKRISAIRRDEIVLKNNDEYEVSIKRTEVEAPLSKQTRKMLHNSIQSTKFEFSPTLARYEPDSVDLLPPTRPRQITPRIPVTETEDLVDIAQDLTEKPTEISIKVLEKKENKLRFSDTPAIPLKGSVRVTQVETLLPEYKSIHPQAPAMKIAPEKPASVMSRPAKKKPVTFTPSTVATTVSTRPTAMSYVPATVGLFLFSIAIFVLPLILDIEVRYEGATSTISFSLDQTALVNFFR